MESRAPSDCAHKEIDVEVRAGKMGAETSFGHAVGAELLPRRAALRLPRGEEGSIMGSRKSADGHQSAFHITDLATYSTDLKKFETFIREHVRDERDVQRLLKEIDEEQERVWADHMVEE